MSRSDAIRPFGPRAVLVETHDPLVVAEHLRELEGVVETVPGARTVLVTHDGRASTVPSIIAEAARPTVTSDQRTSGPLITIDVVYDGPDLVDVAAQLDMDVAALVDAHTSVEHVVRFCGFAPGFGYLGDLPTALRVPRRESPRTRVPAGSVAIAGPYSAIYPSDSPGGWNLLGRTNIRIWDQSADPPALLTPGTRVVFRAVPDLPIRVTQPSPVTERRRPTDQRTRIEVIDPGILTTVQDLGRRGWASLGVPPSGALDRTAHERANALVGNIADAATLEVVAGGIRLRMVDRQVVAVTGADCPGVAMDVAITLEAGDELVLSAPRDGFRTYVGVAGGVDTEIVLGSRSRDQLSLLGRPPLVRGDILSVGGSSAPDGREPLSPAAGLVAPRVSPDTIRLWPGPRTDMLLDALTHLTSHAWLVDRDVNRVGVRLVGAALSRTSTTELPSEGLVTGAVQIPHDGQPIVMLADHPTTGGYPVVAVVDPRDLDLLAHLRPGDRVRFSLVQEGSTDEGIG